jgi:hypothetical protein
MSIVQRHLAEHEERLVLIEEICIDTGALVLDTARIRLCSKYSVARRVGIAGNYHVHARVTPFSES